MPERQRSSFIAPAGVATGKSLDFRERGLQRIYEMLAKDQRHACKGLKTRLQSINVHSSESKKLKIDYLPRKHLCSDAV